MRSNSGLKKNFLYSISYQIFVIILPLITAPYVTRILGAKALGVYSKSQALANYFLLFAMLGVNNYGNRAIARVRENHENTNKTFWEIYFFQIITAVISSCVYLIYSFSFVSSNQVIYLMQFFYVISSLLDINWFCFGMEKFKLTSIRSIIVRILTVFAVFLLVKSKNDLWLYTFIMSFSFILSNIVVWPFVLKQIKYVRPTCKGIKRHIKPNFILFWPVIAVSLYNIMDKLMLGWFSTNEEVAFYTYAERIIAIPTTLILALDNVIMPRMSNMYVSEANSSKIKYLMDNVMLFAMFMASAMSFGLAGVSEVFAPWFYGDSFSRCGYFIFLLSPIIIFKAWAGALRTQYIIPTGRDKIYVFSLTAGAMVNLMINLLLIPRMNGIGAIIGTIVAELVVCFLQFYWCRNDIDIKNYLMNGLSFCVFGAVMFFVVKALSNISGNPLITLTVQVVSGAFIYILLSCFYLIIIRKNTNLLNEVLQTHRIKNRL